MKKKLIAVLAVLVLMFSLIPAAAADDTEYIYVDVGESLYKQLLEFPNGTGYSYDLPGGLYIQEDGHAGQMGLVLCGAIYTPGTYEVNIYVEDMGTWSYRVVVADPQPIIDWPYIVFQSRGQECEQGGDCYIYVEVENPSGLDLYYSWYRDGAWYRDGSSGTYADSSKLGTSYYYCEVGFYINGEYQSITSNRIGVQITAPELMGLYIYSSPNKKLYNLGDNLNTEGLGIVLCYSNGEEKVVWSGFKCSPTVMNKVGKQWIDVEYDGVYTGFEVDVREHVTIKSINVYQLPDKLNYNVGDKLDFTGLKVRVNYSDGGSTVIQNGFTCTPATFKHEGTQKVTVTYEGATTTFEVNVQDPDKSAGISVETLPAKVVYKVGDSLDVTGMKIRLSTKDGSSIVDALNNSKLSFSPVQFTKEGLQTVKVTYKDTEEYTCEFSVQVEKAKGTEPGPSASPGSETEKTEEAGSSSNTLLTVLLVVAIAAVAALGVTVAVLLKKKRG